jgi:short-subunit dehydrogenase
MIDIDKYGPWAVVAGGSEGVGAAFAERLARQGFKLLLIARKPAPLQQLAADIRKRFGTEVRALSLDLTSQDAAQKVIEAAKGCEVGLMIYNAGADSSFNYFIDRPIEESERMVMLNVMTPMRLVRHLAVGMAERRKGGFILCSSLAGLAGSPGNGVYSAAKAFIDTFAEMAWYELGKQGIDVLGAIFPLVRTPAMERLGLKFDGKIKAAESGDIADEVLANIKNGPALHAGGTTERGMRLRGLPRDKAVYTMLGVVDSVQES